MNDGGDGRGPHTPESKIKMSIARLGKKSSPKSPEGLERIRSYMKNRVVSEETKKKIGEASKGRIPYNKGKIKTRPLCLICNKSVKLMRNRYCSRKCARKGDR
jgi:hypothetical protein